MKKVILSGDIDLNSYFIESNKHCFIVDPTYPLSDIKAFIVKHGLIIDGILLTNAHLDNLSALVSYNASIFMHRYEYDILYENAKLQSTLSGNGNITDLSNLLITVVQDGSVLSLENKNVEVLYTPGHSYGSVCYKEGNCLFTGDTLLQGTVGKWNTPTGNIEELKNSILFLIDSNDPETVIYPKHGLKTTVGQEKVFNYFYRTWKMEQMNNSD